MVALVHSRETVGAQLEVVSVRFLGDLLVRQVGDDRIDQTLLAELEDLDALLFVVPDKEGIETFGLLVAGQFNTLFVGAFFEVVAGGFG